MIKESNESILNRHLAECEQLYRRVQSLSGWDFADWSTLNLNDVDSKREALLLKTLSMLLRSFDVVESTLVEIMLDSPRQDIAEKPLQFYRIYLRPNRQKLIGLKFKLIFEPAELRRLWSESTQLKNKEEIKPILSLLDDSVYFYRQIDEDDKFDGLFTEEQFDTVELLLRSPFFKPDEWLRNIKSLEPILGKGSDKPPRHIKDRLIELYRSYALANYVAVMALSRSILEYTLRDKSKKLGMQPDPKGEVPLGHLVGQAVQGVPDLKNDMDLIVEYGNRSMHPKKDEKIFFLPEAVHENALDSIRAVCRVVEQIYMR